MEDVADVIFGGVNTIDHSHQQGLPRGDSHSPTGTRACHVRGRRRRHGRSWSRGRNGTTGTAREGERYKIGGIESLNFPIDLKAHHRLRAAEILSLQNAAVFQFKCIRRCCGHHEQPEPHHREKAI